MEVCRPVGVDGRAGGRRTVAIGLARTGSVLGAQITHGVIGRRVGTTISSIVIGIAVDIVVGIGYVWLLKTASHMQASDDL